MNPAANSLNNNDYPPSYPVPYQLLQNQQGHPLNYSAAVQIQGEPPVGNQSGQIPIIVINGNLVNVCKFCHKFAGFYHRRKAGCAVWSWGILLCFFTGCCCWIPCVIDECYDEEIICSNCQGVKAYFKSSYEC